VSTSWLLFFLASGLTTAWLAERKGYAPRVWFWLGALLGLIAIGVLARQPVRAREERNASEP
jgi:4-amino-4-deoxy-L-arabinose transferase-like glycosyltransferase